MSFREFRFDLGLYVCNRLVAYIPIFRIRNWFYRTIMEFRLGNQSQVFMGAWFDCRQHLDIGDRTIVNRNCSLDNRGGIKIGNDVLLSPEVMLITADHDIQSDLCAGRTQPIQIDNHVFIGSRAIVLPGVHLKEGAVVCAGAVVTRDVESNSIVAGVPAQIIGKRDSSLDYQTVYRRWFN